MLKSPRPAGVGTKHSGLDLDLTNARSCMARTSVTRVRLCLVATGRGAGCWPGPGRAGSRVVIVAGSARWAFWFGYEAGAFTGGCQIVRGQFGAAPPGGGEQPVAIDDDALLRPGGKVRAAGWFRSLVGKVQDEHGWWWLPARIAAALVEVIADQLTLGCRRW